MRPQHHNIWILLRARFSRFYPPSKPVSIEDLKEHFENWEDNIPSLDDDETDEFYAVKHHALLLMDTENKQLQTMADGSLASAIAKHPFNHNDYLATDATYEQWLKCEYLKIEEAAALSVGRNPEKILEIIAEQHLGLDAIQMQIKDAMRMLARLKSISHENDLISPSDFLQWIKSIDCEQSVAITKCAPDNTLQDNKINKTANKSAVTNERNKMLLLIIGMAMAKYNHKPNMSRTSTATNIKDGLSKLGIDITDDTIRKYLSEAKELLPDLY